MLYTSGGIGLKVERLNSFVSLVEVAMPDGDPVRAALVEGSRHRVVVDTLLAPADVASFGSASIVVYTHADWDHCWGTNAFPGAVVVGHQLTRERLLGAAEAETFAKMTATAPERFTGAAIVPPAVTFTDQLAIDAGGVTLCLHHMPGHTADSVWTHLPELDLVLAGDCLEDPQPSFNEAGHLRTWAAALRRWAQAGVKQVVPSHGRVLGPELIQRNLTYLDEMLGGVQHALDRGLTLEAILAEMPVERFLPDVDRYPAYYRKTHPANVKQAVAELTSA
jgi:glyoxylase-like metal-dependent hydrolase (beta-lactamase superfamily II)